MSPEGAGKGRGRGIHTGSADAFPGCAVEFVHLGDGTVTEVSCRPRLGNPPRSQHSRCFRRSLPAAFPETSPPMTCPRCPAFFICGPVPAGPLTKKNLPRDITGRALWLRLVLRSPPAAVRRQQQGSIPWTHSRSSRPIDVDDLETAIREGRPLHPARAYRIKVADETLDFRPIEVVDPCRSAGRYSKRLARSRSTSSAFSRSCRTANSRMFGWTSPSISAATGPRSSSTSAPTGCSNSPSTTVSWSGASR